MENNPANQALSQYEGLEFFIECNYNLKLLSLENLQEFYHATLNQWHDKKISIKNKNKTKQITWINRNVRIDRKPIYIKSWCIKGIRCIEDLLNVNVTFLALSEMKGKYNFECPFTSYYGLLRAIQTEWNSALRVTASEHSKSQQCRKHPSLQLFSTKQAYSTILDRSFSATTAEGRILKHGLTKEEISNIYILPFKILKEPNWSCSSSKLFTISYLLSLASSTRA